MGRKRGSSDAAKPGAPAWMCTFSDMMSLLLTFFILLLSFSTLDNRKVREVLGSLKGALGVLNRDAARNTPSLIEFPSGTPAMGKRREIGPRQAVEAVQQSLESKGLHEKIGVQVHDEGVVLTLDAETLFDSGSAELKEEAQRLLRTTGEILARFDQKVRVEGHTDDLPVGDIYRDRFPTNWELSTARALSVLHFLADQPGLNEKRFFVAGYADTRPVEENISFRARRKNRRVELVLIAEESTQGRGGPSLWYFPAPRDASLAVPENL